MTLVAPGSCPLVRVRRSVRGERVVFATPCVKHALVLSLSLTPTEPLNRVAAPQRLQASGARSDWIGVEHMQGNPNVHGSAPGTVSGHVSQRWLLVAYQRGESFLYALLTKQGAVKIGVSGNLANRKSSIGFGGVRHYLAFRPGDYEDEQRIHQSLSEHRILSTREYYYPVPEILPAINEMRAWMGVKELKRRALPRLSECHFHRAVMDAEAHGGSVLQRVKADPGGRPLPTLRLPSRLPKAR